MNHIKLNDAIICLNKNEDPLFGSLSYTKPASQNTIITVEANNKIIKMPLRKIKLAVFKLDAKTYGFIFKSLFRYDNDCKYWDNELKRLASHDLKPNF